jgi:hypothetical protein
VAPPGMANEVSFKLYEQLQIHEALNFGYNCSSRNTVRREWNVLAGRLVLTELAVSHGEKVICRTELYINI